MKLITKIEPVAARAVVSKTRVAAYCRVSTGMEGQLVSFETQRNNMPKDENVRGVQLGSAFLKVHAEKKTVY